MIQYGCFESEVFSYWWLSSPSSFPRVFRQCSALIEALASLFNLQRTICLIGVSLPINLEVLGPEWWALISRALEQWDLKWRDQKWQIHNSLISISSFYRALFWSLESQDSFSMAKEWSMDPNRFWWLITIFKCKSSFVSCIAEVDFVLKVPFLASKMRIWFFCKVLFDILECIWGREGFSFLNKV